MRVESEKFYTLHNMVQQALGEVHRVDSPAKNKANLVLNKEEARFLFYLLESLPDIIADHKTHYNTLKIAGIL